MQKIVAVALAVLALPLVPWTGSEAQTLICASDALAKPDQRRLLNAARAGLPDDVTLQAPTACRNPGSARAWLETERRPTAEGAQQWWTINCKRGQRDWSCDPPHLQRSATMTLVIDGRVRTINLSFDGSISLADAQELTSRAWSIYEDATAAPAACSSLERKDWERMRAAYPLNLSASELDASVSLEEEAREVSLFGHSGLTLSFRPDSNGQFTLPACWIEWIVVT